MKLKSTLLAICALALCSCEDDPKPVPPVTAKTDLAFIKLRTVLHDGHQFVVVDNSAKTALLHHPSCSTCVKQLEVAK